MLSQFKVPAENEVRVAEQELKRTVEQIFLKMGVRKSDAVLGADVLTMADMRGVDTHGVSNILLGYVSGYSSGQINPAPNWSITR